MTILPDLECIMKKSIFFQLAEIPPIRTIRAFSYKIFFLEKRKVCWLWEKHKTEGNPANWVRASNCYLLLYNCSQRIFNKILPGCSQSFAILSYVSLTLLSIFPFSWIWGKQKVSETIPNWCDNINSYTYFFRSTSDPSTNDSMIEIRK